MSRQGKQDDKVRKKPQAEITGDSSPTVVYRETVTFMEWDKMIIVLMMMMMMMMPVKSILVSKKGGYNKGSHSEMDPNNTPQVLICQLDGEQEAWVCGACFINVPVRGSRWGVGC